MTQPLRSSNTKYPGPFVPRQVFRLVPLLLLAIFAASAFVLPIAAAKTLFVTQSGANAKTGLSWGNASSDLQAMIDASVSGDEIWVAGGTYNVPSGNISFTLKEGVKVYGGFAGTEGTLANRNLALIANKSILSAGGIKNSVVSNSTGLTTATRLDGFTITGALKGGILNSSSSSPMLVNLNITGNTGPGVGNIESSPTLINCAIVSNNSVIGMINSQASPIIINCTIARNEESNVGVGIFNLEHSSPKIRNSVLSARNSGFNNESSSSSVDIQYSLLHSESGIGVDGSTVKNNVDPLFSNPALGDYTLQKCSPGVNGGSNAVYANGQTPDITTDLAGQSRFFGGGPVDMGAYEYQQERGVPIPGVRFVKEGGTGNGISWDCAMGSLQQALASATSEDQIWVAAGTYLAGQAAFNLKPGLKLYGGFAGTETSLANRDLSITSNKSILRRTGNTVMEIYSDGQIPLKPVTVDGFTITGGATGILNFRISPTLANLVITGISQTGIANAEGAPTLINCAIVGNIGTSEFAGVGNTNASPVIINCTIAGNSAPDGKSIGMFNGGTSAPKLRNSIIYGNQNGIVSGAGSTGITTIEHSIVESNKTVNPPNPPIPDIDPLFVNAAGGDYRLQTCSPAINKGRNAYYASGQTPDISGINKDLVGNNRFYNNGTVDMGAFEYQFDLLPSVWYVKAGGKGSGVSWDCATGDLQSAIMNAASGEQVWVAGGTYQPADNGNFSMKEGVKIYGGFAGKETSLAARDLTIVANKSILQAYGHTVIYNFGLTLTTAAMLDGFTIRGSSNGPGIQNYSGASPMLSNLIITEHTAHGGMTIWGSSPVLINCSFTGNYSAVGGGLLISGGSPKLINCSFTGNSGGDGAGIFIDNASPILVNCLIKGNTASGGGGGMCVTTSTTSLTNCTIVANTASGQGGAILNRGPSPLTLRNSIVYGNNSGIVNLNPPAITVQYSLVQGQDTPNPSDHNIAGNINPLFIDAAAGNYRLQPCSPLVNAGFNYFQAGLAPDLSGIASDLNGNPRMRELAVDMGAYEFSSTSRGLAVDGDEAVGVVNGDFLLISGKAGCGLLAYVSPNPGAPLNGDIKAKVWVATDQPTNYVKRHYQIAPASGGRNATAKVTLYFTQQEFTDFNMVSPIKLPINAADVANYKANLRVEKRSGISNTDFGLPASYTGGIETITPSQANGKVEWNADAGRWQVVFDVTGFSGFFVKTIQTALPLNLISFTATKETGGNVLQWSTTSEINTDHFEVQSSRDAKNFIKVATVEAAGSGDSKYLYNDRTSHRGTIYYRLKMSDVDGTFTHSKIILIAGDQNFTGIYPNPAGAMVTFQVSDELLKTTANMYDISGRHIQSILITASKQQINIKALISGLYILRFADGTVERFVKE